MNYDTEKKEIIFWGKQLYDKGLNSGNSGNISKKIGDNILFTVHGSYLGFLEKKDIILMDKKGNVVDGDNNPTSEKLLHIAIYDKYPEKSSIIHVHAPYTTHYFHYFDDINIITFEEKVNLGKIVAIPQDTPTVTDVLPVLTALENNDIVVLKNHGVVAAGDDFISTFSLIELLEINARLNLISAGIGRQKKRELIKDTLEKELQTYELFSDEHINALVRTINSDETARSLGEKYNLTTVLCNKETDGKAVISYYYDKGKIVKTNKSDEKAQFTFSSKKKIWRKVFNGELDPFVATNRGKIKFKGDFNQLSQWFPVFERTFALWKKVPVK